MTTFPRQKFAGSLPEAQAVATALKFENELARNPLIWGWYRGDDYDAASGACPDHRWRERGSYNRALFQAASGYRPTKTANWQSTGFAAMTFDGVDDRLQRDFPYPNGISSFVAVHSVPTGSGTFTAAIVGGADSGSGGLLFGVRRASGVYNARLFSGSGGLTGSVAIAPSSKILQVGAFDHVNAVWASRVNGSNWSTGATTNSNVTSEAAMLIGNTNNDFDSPFNGSLAELIEVGVSLYSSRHAALRTMIETYLAAKYGIALP